MAKLSELREILLTNQINGYMHYDKKQLIVLLGEKGLLPLKPEKVKKEINHKFEKLATIRNNPKQVILKNVKTGGTITFPSIFTKRQNLLIDLQELLLFGIIGCGIIGMKLR